MAVSSDIRAVRDGSENRRCVARHHKKKRLMTQVHHNNDYDEGH